MELKDIVKALNIFKDITREHDHQELTLTAAHLFLVIASNPTASSRDLREIAGLDPVTISRVAQTLSLGRKRGSVFQQGLGLISLSPDATDYRSNLYTLTPKGKKLLEALKKI